MISADNTKKPPWSIRSPSFTFVSLLFTVMLVFPIPAAPEIKLLKGQTVYVPAYSHIYHGDREQPFYLAVTLSIRNTDLVHPITIVSIDYFDSDGKRLKKFVDKEVKLSAMATAEYVVKESDKAGGSGGQLHRCVEGGRKGHGTDH